MGEDVGPEPESISIEVEPTNYCNASCVFCPRHQLTAPLGTMTEATFDYVIERCKNHRANLNVNRGCQTEHFPTITFSGLGEPLLNPHIDELIAHANRHGFETRLITNGALLDEVMIARLLKAGLKRLSVSFVGIEKDAYEQFMRNLKFERALRNLELVVAAAAGTTLSLAVMLSRNRLIPQADDEIIEFWQKRGIYRVVIGSAPHNRGGHLGQNELWVFDRTWHVNYDRVNWCNRLSYIATICWNGDLVLCCHDYLGKSVILGNVSTHSLEEIEATKSNILEQKVQFALCQECNESFAFQSSSYIRQWVENEFAPIKSAASESIVYRNSIAPNRGIGEH